MPNFAEIAKPLTALTKKEVPLTWTNEWTFECQESFDKLKHAHGSEILQGGEGEPHGPGSIIFL